ncbi:energy transducer TonB [Puteibacter caeruleilacunae]|nr:energy transducer TonB [Puteibacter caeruleilacunae]
MEVKKSPKADLENKRNIFVQLGLVVTLGIVLIAFNWNNSVQEASSLGQVQEQEVEDEIIPITRQEEVKPPPPPPPPKTFDVLNIVDDDTEIEEELEIEDTEIDDETAIDVAPVLTEEEEEDDADAPVFVVVEDMPEFPGGDLALRKYIATSIKYPVIAQENGIQGKVYVTFVVNKQGRVENARIARGVDPSLDKEALRVVNGLPAWKPGKQRGKPVKVSFTVPINFVLQ